MSDYCSDPVTCRNGDCIGCKKGVTWCQDPRCDPYCPGQGCSIPNNHDFNVNLVILVILLCLMAILFIVWFAYGPQLFEDHDDHARANVIVPKQS